MFSLRASICDRLGTREVVEYARTETLTFLRRAVRRRPFLAGHVPAARAWTRADGQFGTRWLQMSPRSRPHAVCNLRDAHRERHRLQHPREVLPVGERRPHVCEGGDAGVQRPRGINHMRARHGLLE